jgi:ferredoxin
MLCIHPDEYVDCGACELVCSVEAIFYEDDVPGQWAQFTTENARLFDPLWPPGGASKTGPLPYATDYVASR